MGISKILFFYSRYLIPILPKTMSRFLITGATGNIGQAVTRHLCSSDFEAQVVAAVRDVERGKKQLPEHERLSSVVSILKTPAAGPRVSRGQFNFPSTGHLTRLFFLRLAPRAMQHRATSHKYSPLAIIPQ